MRFIDRDEVARRLTYDVCIPIVREAMIAFSKGETQAIAARHPATRRRTPVRLDARRHGRRSVFGAKLISVFPENFAQRRAVAPRRRRPVRRRDAARRSASCTPARSPRSAPPPPAPSPPMRWRAKTPRASPSSATASRRAPTRAPSARCARSTPITVWGRSAERAHALRPRDGSRTRHPRHVRTTAPRCRRRRRHRLHRHRRERAHPRRRLGAPGHARQHRRLELCRAPSKSTTTSSYASRFIADSREGVLAQGAEFLRAKEAGLVGDDHVVAEIGQVLDGTVPGRRASDEITAYKSLGHIVQDLATAWALYQTRS